MSSQRRFSLVAIGLFAFAVTAGLNAQTAQEKEIAERIKPAGEVCIEGDASCAAPVVAVASGPRSGDQVYDTACVACHGAGIGGAPKLGDTADWAPRIAQGEETLLTHAIGGFSGAKGMMPPRGTCMNCSDEEIKLAVEYMVAKSQ